MTVAPRGVVAKLTSDVSSSSQDAQITLSAEGSVDLDGRGVIDGLNLVYSCATATGGRCTMASGGELNLAPLIRGTRFVAGGGGLGDAVFTLTWPNGLTMLLWRPV